MGRRANTFTPAKFALFSVLALNALDAPAETIVSWPGPLMLEHRLLPDGNSSPVTI